MQWLEMGGMGEGEEEEEEHTGEKRYSATYAQAAMHWLIHKRLSSHCTRPLAPTGL